MHSSKKQRGEKCKPPLTDQNQEIEENNRMGKSKDLFKKIGDIKGKLHERMGMIKDRISKDLKKV